MSFLVFAGEHYYPVGGFRDFRSAHVTLSEAQAAAEAIRAEMVPNRAGDPPNYVKNDWVHIGDSETLVIVEPKPDKWGRWAEIEGPVPA